MKKNNLLFLFFFILTLQTNAQKITNITSTQAGKDIVVSYKIEEANKDKVFPVKLYYSTDGGDSYKMCNSIKADYGIPNQVNKIKWSVTKDIHYFVSHNIKFKVSAVGRYTIDGAYKTVKIGNQIWLAENLRLDIGIGCNCFDNIESNAKKHGRLYTYDAAMRASKEIIGWHLPSYEDWEQLTDHLWGARHAGKLLKSTSSDWGYYKGNNESGFNADPAPNGIYDSDHIGVDYWCSAGPERYDGSYIWNAWLRDNFLKLGFSGSQKNRNTYSVRLIKD